MKVGGIETCFPQQFDHVVHLVQVVSQVGLGIPTEMR